MMSAMITTLTPKSPGAALATPVVGNIRAFLDGFTIETTRPKDSDIAAMQGITAPGTQVYVSAIPTRPVSELADQSAIVRKGGFEPVPHLAVRNFASRDELSGVLARLQSEAAVRRVLVISGDRADPAGPYSASLEVIESGILQRHGITEIGIAGHPDGHPTVANDVMQRALAAKIEAAEQSGLKADIVTQFSFDAPGMIRWVKTIRDRGIEARIWLGLAGPTNLTTLLKYAQRCGVKASVGGVTRNAGLVKHLFGTSAPDALVRALADENATGSLGDVGAHFFSFGGVGATARWAAHAAQGRIRLEGDGFSVEP